MQVFKEGSTVRRNTQHRVFSQYLIHGNLQFHGYLRFTLKSFSVVILFLLIIRTSTMLKIFQKHRYFCCTAVLRKSKTVHCYYYLHNIGLHERFVFVNLETDPLN